MSKEIDSELALRLVLKALAVTGRLNKNGMSGRDDIRFCLAFAHLASLGYSYDDSDIMSAAHSLGFADVFVSQVPDSLSGDFADSSVSPEAYEKMQAWAETIVNSALADA